MSKPERHLTVFGKDAVPLKGKLSPITGDLFQDASEIFASLPPDNPYQIMHEITLQLWDVYPHAPHFYRDEIKRYQGVLKKIIKLADHGKNKGLAIYARKQVAFWFRKENGNIRSESRLRICVQKKLGQRFDRLIKKLEKHTSIVTKPVANRKTSKQNSITSKPSLFINVFDKNGVLKSLKAIEEEVVQIAFEVCGGSRAKVARELRIGRTTLYRKTEATRPQVKCHRKPRFPHAAPLRS